MECRRSPSFFRSSVTVQVRGAQEMFPLHSCFGFCHREGLDCPPQLAVGWHSSGAALVAFGLSLHMNGFQRKLLVVPFHLYAFL